MCGISRTNVFRLPLWAKNTHLWRLSSNDKQVVMGKRISRKISLDFFEAKEDKALDELSTKTVDNYVDGYMEKIELV